MIFLKKKNFSWVPVFNGIAIGGDSDTIAAITGGIVAAYYGIPDDIAQKGLEYLDETQKGIVKRFYKKYDKRKRP